MQDCIFCRIIAGDISADLVYQNENMVVFRDINPVAPVHLLVVPRRHIKDILELAAAEDGLDLMGAVLRALPEIAAKVVVTQGFRLINNCGPDGGQTIPHIHFHLIGGQKLGEKLL